MKNFFLKLLYFLLPVFLFTHICAAEASPQSLKEGTLAKLEAVKDASRGKVRRAIRRAEREIEKSLSDWQGTLFLDEARILPAPRGKKVFEHTAAVPKATPALLPCSLSAAMAAHWQPSGFN